MSAKWRCACGRIVNSICENCQVCDRCCDCQIDLFDRDELGIDPETDQED